MPADRHPPESPAPVLLRVAGLPASVMADFHAGECAAHAQRLLAIEADLAAARAAFADRLYDAVNGAPPAGRRLLLAVRRDCWNARPLARHRDAPGWDSVAALPGAATILHLEAVHDRLAVALAAAYARARESESASLFAAAADPALLRGIAIASPVLAGELAGLTAASRTPRPTGARDRRQRKAETSLLRFTSRAALKLSPYSSFTRLALGVATGGRGSASAALGWEPGAWSERSLLRLKRYAVDQCVAALLEHPPLRAALPVALNDTVEEVAPGRLRFLRPGLACRGGRAPLEPPSMEIGNAAP